MADQEFLASFKVEIDESGLERLKEALTQNTRLAEDLAAAFDAARDAVNGFFSELSSATLSTGELSPYEQLKSMAEEEIQFKLQIDTYEAEEELNAFVEAAQKLFDATKFPLNADVGPAQTAAEETVSFLEELFVRTVLPLNAEGKKARQEGQSVLDELLRQYGATELPLYADVSGVLRAGQAALKSLQDLYSSTTLTVNVQEVTSTTTTASGNESVSSNVSERNGSGKSSADRSGSGSGNEPGNGSGSSSGESNLVSVSRPSAGLSLISVMKAAAGGRFSAPTQAEIAEDGDPEYVIPVKKESIAVPLLQQLIGELSDGARETLQMMFPGKGENEKSKTANENFSSISEMFAAVQGAAAPVITQNNNQSVQAPVSIQVQAAGSDPEEVGRSIYNVAEQYLLRTLHSAMNA